MPTNATVAAPKKDRTSISTAQAVDKVTPPKLSTVRGGAASKQERDAQNKTKKIGLNTTGDGKWKNSSGKIINNPNRSTMISDPDSTKDNNVSVKEPELPRLKREIASIEEQLIRGTLESLLHL